MAQEKLRTRPAHQFTNHLLLPVRAWRVRGWDFPQKCSHWCDIDGQFFLVKSHLHQFSIGCSLITATRFWQRRVSVTPKHAAVWQAALSSGVSLPAEPCRHHLENKCLGVGMVLALGRWTCCPKERQIGPTGRCFTKSCLGQIEGAASGLHSSQEETGL